MTDETKKEPTTAEAFATVREFVEDADEGGPTSRALSLLELRMGAMARASRDLIAALESTRWSSGCWCSGKVKAGHSATCAGRQAAINMAEKALLDAPPVFSLEDVVESLVRSGADADSIQSECERIAALRSSGGGR